MSITRLPEIVFPLAQVNKVNEIVDVLNDNLNMYYSATNPALTPVEGVATWTVTHNLGTENINCSLFNGDNLVISNVSIVSENVVSVSFNASSSISEDTYKIVIISNGAGSSSGSGSYVLPTASTTTLGGVRIDGSSITINNGVISTKKDSYLRVTGQIAKGANDSVAGMGVADIYWSSTSGLVVINFNYKVTTAGTSTSDFTYGLSVEAMKALNSNVPNISPLTSGSGVCNVYENSGVLSMDNGNFGWCLHGETEGYWAISRVYKSGNNYLAGPYPTNILSAGRYISGTAYGVIAS